MTNTNTSLPNVANQCKTINVCFALWAICLGSIILGLALFVFGTLDIVLEWNPDENLVTLLGVGTLFYEAGDFLVMLHSANLPAIIGLVIFQYFLLYHCWKLIPADIARTTPIKAVGFLLIPIFNLYWMFVAYRGLAKDMNKTSQRCGVQFSVRESFGLHYCWLWLVYFPALVCAMVGIDDLLTVFGRNVTVLNSLLMITFIGCLAGLIALVMLIGFLWSVKNGAIALLKHGDSGISDTIVLQRKIEEQERKQECHETDSD